MPISRSWRIDFPRRQPLAQVDARAQRLWSSRRRRSGRERRRLTPWARVTLASRRSLRWPNTGVTSIDCPGSAWSEVAPGRAGTAVKGGRGDAPDAGARTCWPAEPAAASRGSTGTPGSTRRPRQPRLHASRARSPAPARPTCGPPVATPRPSLQLKKRAEKKSSRAMTGLAGPECSLGAGFCSMPSTRVSGWMSESLMAVWNGTVTMTR
jgi:hypothetical protein